MKKHKKLFYITLIYLCFIVVYFIISYIIFFYRLDASVKHYRRFLSVYNNKKFGSKYKWPDRITKYVKINDYRFKYTINFFTKYSDIFEYSLEDIFKKINNISSITNDKNFQEYASQTSILLNDYQPSKIFVASETNQNSIVLPIVSEIEEFTNDFIIASDYYAFKRDSKTALLLSFLPILVTHELEANNVDYSDPHLKISLMGLRNRACMNLLFIANNIPIDKETSIKISKILIKIAKLEPSLQRCLDYTRQKINNQPLKGKTSKTEYFFAKIYDSKSWKDIINYIYDGFSEGIKNVESGKDPYILYAWQEEIHNLLSEIRNKKGKINIQKYLDWQRYYTLSIISNHSYYQFFIDFYNLYQKREKYLALTESTAIALALAAYSSDKDADIDDIYNSMPKNANELSKWLGIELPIDRISKSAYQFYFADDYFLGELPTNNNSDSNNNLFYLINRWVVNSQPTINGIPIPLVSTPKEDDFGFGEYQKRMENLNKLSQMLKDY